MLAPGPTAATQPRVLSSLIITMHHQQIALTKTGPIFPTPTPAAGGGDWGRVRHRAARGLMVSDPRGVLEEGGGTGGGGGWSSSADTWPRACTPGVSRSAVDPAGVIKLLVMNNARGRVFIITHNHQIWMSWSGCV